MRYVRVRNTSRQSDIVNHVRVATSLLDRAVGLLGTPTLGAGEGLWINPCKGVHTFFMRYPIDVLFLTEEGQVLHRATLPPWRMSTFFRQCRSVLELPQGTLQRTGTEVGDRLEMKDLN